MTAEKKKDILSDLTPPQREAVTHVKGPLLILAGAGSGKTRVVTRRVAYLLQQGISANSILAITFTNKAANEMKDRVAALTAERGLHVSTFHAFCARQLRRFAKELGLPPGYTIYDSRDKEKLIKEVMHALNIDAKSLAPAYVDNAISRAKNDLILPSEYASRDRSLSGQDVARIYARYEKEMASRGALDFDDLLLRMVQLLRQHEHARRTLEAQFLYVMVDEYQDTNDAQYLIIRELTRKHANIAVTGDPDQAIYGWRGANIGNILSFERDYPGAKTVLLEQNYRSTKTILAAAHGLIGHNTHRKEKRIFTENKTGTAVKLFETDNETAEAEIVSSEIRQSLRRGTRPNEIAVFYRINAMSLGIEKALRSAFVPYRVISGQAFYERMEIMDMMAYLRVLVNAKDELAVVRIINTPPRGIGKTSIDHVKDFAHRNRLTMQEGLRRAGEIEGLQPRAKSAIADLVDLLDHLRAMPQDSPQKILKEILDKTKYTQQFAKSDDDKSRIENVHELVSDAANYEEHAIEPSLIEFLEQRALASDQDEYDEVKDAVSLMTMHAAKGLEFPVVFIMGLEEDIIPHARSQESDAQVEEERRLLYVGMTRAKERLTMSLARSRRKFGDVIFPEPSRFIEEIPPQYLDRMAMGSAEQPVYSKRTTEPPARKKAGEKKKGSLRVLSDGSQPAPEEGEPEAPPMPGIKLAKGDRVRHKTYGVGTVESITGMGDQTRAHIRFGKQGSKTMILKFAKLEKLTTE